MYYIVTSETSYVDCSSENVDLSLSGTKNDRAVFGLLFGTFSNSIKSSPLGQHLQDMKLPSKEKFKKDQQVNTAENVLVIKSH